MTQNSQKSQQYFLCEKCDYECCRKNDFNKHLLTAKHKNNDVSLQNNLKTLKKFICSCGKEYNYRQGLYFHKKTCKIDITNELEINDNDLINNAMNSDKDLIMMLVKQNSELLEVLKNGTHNTNNSHNNTVNNNNKTFNLQFFLNETCKDAMNIMDFVDSIKLQLSDLEKVGEIGYVEGISNIITKNLKALDVTQRPIHCTDKKREVVYIKDEDKWEKEDNDKKKLRKAIKKVASKNQRLILKFQEKHPDCGKASSLFSDQFNKIIVESMGGSGDNDIEKEDKIIRKISSVTTINKE
jgi:hypothetical protein